MPFILICGWNIIAYTRKKCSCVLQFFKLKRSATENVISQQNVLLNQNALVGFFLDFFFLLRTMIGTLFRMINKLKSDGEDFFFMLLYHSNDKEIRKLVKCPFLFFFLRSLVV